MKLFYPIAATVLLVGSAFTFITAPNWQIADNYSIAFSNDQAGGIFKDFKGTIAFDDKNPATAKFDVSIAVASLNTGNALQNKHAKSAEWFDATKYPTIHFVSTKVVKAGNGYQVTGTLDMHGVQKPVTIPFTFQHAGAGGTFAGTFTINRSDFKIGEPGGEVSEPVKLEIAVPVK
ncbi:MAG TPA: YceI family protein [Puia sp.]|nr:YceI family protein [Puia sp.]